MTKTISPKSILVTAFEPFGGEAMNPTRMILERLPDRIGACALRKLVLPVAFVRAGETACAEYDRVSPAAVIMLGQAGGRSAVTPETTAKNLMTAKIPDNAGYQPQNVPIVPGGPDILRSTFSVSRIVEAVRALNIPCEPSDDAGTYVCNSLLYSMLSHNGGEVPTGFIHVPYLPEQGHADQPAMRLEDMVRAIIAAIGANVGIPWK